MLSTTIHYCSDAWRGKKHSSSLAERTATEGIEEEQEVVVHDARSLVQGGSSLGKHGLTLTTIPHRVTDWRDPVQIRDLYCPDIVNCVRDFTGAKDVSVLDYKIRDGKPADFAGFYASFAHSDITPYIEWQSGIPQDGRLWERIQHRHFAIINCWRAFEGNPVEDNHLIFLDPQTVQKQDMVVSEGANKKEKFQIFRLVHCEDHRWLYFPKMTDDEVVVFKQYDTRQSAPELRQVFHTAAPDRTCPPNKPPRKSIEVRLLCFFDEDVDNQRSKRFAAEVPPPSDEYRNLPLPYHWHNFKARSSIPATQARNPRL